MYICVYTHICIRYRRNYGDNIESSRVYGLLEIIEIVQSFAEIIWREYKKFQGLTFVEGCCADRTAHKHN